MLIQDHERCLLSEDSQQAIADAGLQLQTDFPKRSPDLNAIEGVWKLLRDALVKNAPSHVESRSEFVARLRRTVTQINRKSRALMTSFCTNQKESKQRD